MEGVGCRGLLYWEVGLDEGSLGGWVSGQETGLISRAPDCEELPRPREGVLGNCPRVTGRRYLGHLSLPTAEPSPMGSQSGVSTLPPARVGPGRLGKQLTSAPDLTSSESPRILLSC